MENDARGGRGGGRDNSSRMNGGDGGRYDDGRMSSRGGSRQHQGIVIGGNSGRSIVINSTVSHHHQHTTRT